MGATERVKEYLEYKGITKYKFYQKTGLSNKFLDNSSNMGTNKAEIILRHYPDINSIWLLTGSGEMLLNSDEKPVSGVEKTKECEKCKILEKENDLLTQLIKSKDETIRAYQSNENNNNNKEESKGRNSA
ncbi:MAG: hypothetical protein ACI9DK_003286 [Vicingaceae bacterium]|jgi:hypothetical protein